MNGNAIPGATLATHVPLQAGYYSVWAGNGNCFSSSSPVLIEFQSLKEWTDLANGLKLGPNPVQRELELNFSAKLPANLLIEISNTNGQIVYSTQVEDSNNTRLSIDFSTFSLGVYTLILKDNERQATFKILKQ